MVPTLVANRHPTGSSIVRWRMSRDFGDHEAYYDLVSALLFLRGECHWESYQPINSTRIFCTRIVLPGLSPRTGVRYRYFAAFHLSITFHRSLIPDSFPHHFDTHPYDHPMC